MQTKRSVIKLDNVGKRYVLYDNPFQQMLGYLGLRKRNLPQKQALDGVNFEIRKGEKVGIVGHNGSGKTTLLRLISGHTKPTSGQIQVGGEVQALMQRGYGFNDELSGLENVRNALVYNGIPQSELAEIETDIIDFVELDKFLHHPIKTYSLGMRARLEFAAATAIRPDVLVIDEVLGAGDGYFVRKCARRMKELVANTTLLLVSHSLDQIREYCDRVIWIDGGGLREDGSVDQVLPHYQSAMKERSTRALRGGNEVNVKGGRLSPDELNTLLRKVTSSYCVAGESNKIIAFGFGDTSDDYKVLETGDPFSLEMQVSIEHPARPVVLGWTKSGALVFRATMNETLQPGNSFFTLKSTRLEVGSGDYILVPALQLSGHEAAFVVGQMGLSLKIAETNWSDPPLVHLNGDWRSGPERKRICSKVSGWV